MMTNALDPMRAVEALADLVSPNGWQEALHIDVAHHCLSPRFMSAVKMTRLAFTGGRAQSGTAAE
jgi:hypothetical protein